MGLILCPLTVRGVMNDGNRLSLWSSSCLLILTPATNTSAPELGRAVSRADPFGVEKWALMVGAGSTLRPFTMNGESEGVGWTSSAIVAGSGLYRAVLAVYLRDLHTFARCPTRLHVWQTRWNAGYRLGPPGWNPDPYLGQTYFKMGRRWSSPRLGRGFCSAWIATSDGLLATCALCRLAALCVQHLEIVVSNERFFSFRRSSTMSLSKRPAIIWSRMVLLGVLLGTE